MAKKTLKDIQAKWEAEAENAQEKEPVAFVAANPGYGGATEDELATAADQLQQEAHRRYAEDVRAQVIAAMMEAARARRIAEVAKAEQGEAVPVPKVLTDEEKRKILDDPQVKILRDLATTVETEVRKAEGLAGDTVSYYFSVAIKGHLEQTVRIKSLTHRVAIASEARELQDRLFPDARHKALAEFLNALGGKNVDVARHQTKDPEDFLANLKKNDFDPDDNRDGTE